MNQEYSAIVLLYELTHTLTHTVDCGSPLPTRRGSINVNYSSTLEGSTLTFRCREGLIPNNVFIATCHPNGLWVPDLASQDLMCSVTVPGKTYYL